MIKIETLPKERFVFGWEPSPDNSSSIRYHLISVAHNRIDAEAKLKIFVEEITKCGPVVVIRQMRKGKTGKSGLEYVFQTFDSQTAHREINKGKLGRNVLMDYRLCERLVRNIDEYVKKICLYI